MVDPGTRLPMPGRDRIPLSADHAAHDKKRWGVIFQPPESDEDRMEVKPMTTRNGCGVAAVSPENLFKYLNIKREGDERYVKQNQAMPDGWKMQVADNTGLPYRPLPTVVLDIGTTYPLHCDSQTTVLGKLTLNSRELLVRFSGFCPQHGSGWPLEELLFWQKEYKEAGERIDVAESINEYSQRTWREHKEAFGIGKFRKWKGRGYLGLVERQIEEIKDLVRRSVAVMTDALKDQKDALAHIHEVEKYLVGGN